VNQGTKSFYNLAMKPFTIALLQMASHGPDQAKNLQKGDDFCRRAAQMGADLALFPEMWNVGYQFYRLGDPASYDAWRSSAVGRDGPYLNHFRALARELKMAIGLTYLETWQPAPRNTISVIDRRGDIVLNYAKVHTCDFDVEFGLTPGDDFPVAVLESVVGPLNIGAMICFDREFPEAARLLMLRGAEIILTPNACELEINRLTQYRARAYENMVGLAMCNYAAPQENGHSIAFSGVAFMEGKPLHDMLLVEAGAAEGVYLATFDLDALRAYRQHEVWGNAFRRPHRYGLLTATQVDAPFQRSDPYGAPYHNLER